MNTKSSVIYGWIVYTAAFAVGGGIGYYNYFYKPGGRMDRERAADIVREREAAREAEEENRIREERRLRKLEQELKGEFSDRKVPMTTAVEDQAPVRSKVPTPQSILLPRVATTLSSSSSSPSPSPQPPTVLSTKEVTTLPSTRPAVTVPIVSAAFVLSPPCVPSSMTTPVRNGQPMPSSLLSPPLKRRRGGRRASNPQISAEERKRQRVLKNRESAMRSLAKKAQFSAMLEKEETDALLQTKASEHTLQKLVHAAISVRTFLDKVPDDVTDLVAQVDSAISRGTDLLENCIDDGVADSLSQECHQSNGPNVTDTT